MLSRNDRLLGFAYVFLLLSVVVASPGQAAVVSVRPPEVVAASNGQNATLSIPRWKGYVDPSQPDRIWLSYANMSSSASNIVFTTDGGDTWQNTGMNPSTNGYLDYHAALVGDGGDLYFTFPGSDGIRVRRFTAPAQSNDDRDPLQVIAGTTAYHRSSITTDGNGRLWVFTRNTGEPAANVRYSYSDDQGQSWTPGVAVSTGVDGVRIGSMQLADGRACLVVLYLMDSRGYEYYVWNGSQFEARPDHSIFAENIGYTRAFTHNVVGDTMHLLFGYGNGIRHIWKTHNDGEGEWNTETVVTDPSTAAFDFLPTSTVRGDELYLFYCRWTEGTVASSNIFARVWNQTSETWGDEIPVSAGTTNNLHPNTCFQVPTASTNIPIFWTAGASGTQIVYSALELDAGGEDDVPPGSIRDLAVHEADAAGTVELDWTAPGDDGDEGQAVVYDIRYSEVFLSGITWPFATQVDDEPEPEEAGEEQNMVVTGLVPGVVYYFGMKTVDEQQNVSNLSNVPRIALPVTTAVPVPGSLVLEVLPNYPNPFNPRTVVPYTLPRAGMTRLAIYDMSGRLAALLVAENQAAGRHSATWDGLGLHGEALPSGTYHVRLTSGNELSTRRVTLLR